MNNVRHLQIELTNHCNLRCVECPQRLMQRERIWMPDNVFQAIRERIIKRYPLETIIPHKDGESLLHPHYFELLQAMSVHHKGKYAIYTNGTHLTLDLYRKLKTLPNRIQLLVSFHFYGVGSKEGIIREYSCDEADEVVMQCLHEPAHNIGFVLSTHQVIPGTARKLAEWRDKWLDRRERFPQLQAVHLNTDINPWAGHIDCGTVHFDACPYGNGDHLFIGVTGNILPCCMDLNEDLTLGNILDEDLDTAWLCREQFYTDVQLPSRRKPRCQECLKGAGA